MKILVLFVFHEYNARVEKFINDAIFPSSEIEFIIICNNKNIKFISPDYVKKIFRDNIGYDFGGWSDALLKDNLYKNYDNFIFVNSSVDGPYLPENFYGKWTDYYINGLENCRLFGSSINTLANWQNDDHKMLRLLGNRINSLSNAPYKYAHVQSYIFSIYKETLEYLITCEIFSIVNYARTFKEAIWREVSMSRKIIEKNWNIGSLMPIYKNIDFTCKNLNNYNIPLIDDPLIAKYKDIYWSTNDLVFIKGKWATR